MKGNCRDTLAWAEELAKKRSAGFGKDPQTFSNGIIAERFLP
jgi:hypothetical protein